MQVITANPKTAGVARWNFLALWGHKMGRGDRAALDFCTQARKHSELSMHGMELYDIISCQEAYDVKHLEPRAASLHSRTPCSCSASIWVDCICQSKPSVHRSV